MPPPPASGVGLLSPDTNILGSPGSAFSVSSTSSVTRKMNVHGESGVATEGFQLVAARDARLRENSAPSRAGRSSTPVPSIEDAQSRDRSPRRMDPIEDGTSGASTFGPRRSRETDHVEEC